MYSSRPITLQKAQQIHLHAPRARINGRVVPRVNASSAQASDKKLQLNIGETSISVPFQEEQAQVLDASFKKLLATFAEKAKAERPKRWEMMECRFKGSGQQAMQLMEFYCNPNAYQNPFDAKVLITIVSNDGIRITTEGRFSTLRADLDGFLGMAAAK